MFKGGIPQLITNPLSPDSFHPVVVDWVLEICFECGEVRNALVSDLAPNMLGNCT